MMKDTLSAEFEDRIAALRGQLAELTGDSLRDALAELESLTDFLDLMALLREPQRPDGRESRRPEFPAQASDAITSAKPCRQEA
jgi:hypothetical protein